MTFEAVVLGLVIGWIRGGRLRRLARLNLPLAWVGVLGITLQWLLDLAVFRRWEWAVDRNFSLHLVSYILLLLFLGVNRRAPGVKMIFTGVLLNLAVTAVNGGLMPVWNKGLPPDVLSYLESRQDGTYTVMDQATRLPFLADILTVPYAPGRLFSAGDLLAASGLLLLIQWSMQNKWAYKITSVRVRMSNHR